MKSETLKEVYNGLNDSRFLEAKHGDHLHVLDKALGEYFVFSTQIEKEVYHVNESEIPWNLLDGLTWVEKRKGVVDVRVTS